MDQNYGKIQRIPERVRLIGPDDGVAGAGGAFDPDALLPFSSSPIYANLQYKTTKIYQMQPKQPIRQKNVR